MQPTLKSPWSEPCHMQSKFMQAFRPNALINTSGQVWDDGERRLLDNKENQLQGSSWTLLLIYPLRSQMMPNKTGTHVGMRVTAEQRVLEGHRLMRAAVAFLQVPSKGHAPAHSTC